MQGDWKPGMNRAEMVPSILIEAVAPDGRKFDLSMILGEWLATLDQEQNLAFYQSPSMSRKMVRSFWQWSGRTDKPPRSLKVWLRANPEYGDWITMPQGHQFVTAKLNGDIKLAEESLLRALRNGQIVSRGTHYRNGDIRNIEFKTDDVVKWLAMEFDIKVSKYDVACYPKSGEILDILSRPPPSYLRRKDE